MEGDWYQEIYSSSLHHFIPDRIVGTTTITTTTMITIRITQITTTGSPRPRTGAPPPPPPPCPKVWRRTRTRTRPAEPTFRVIDSQDCSVHSSPSPFLSRTAQRRRRLQRLRARARARARGRMFPWPRARRRRPLREEGTSKREIICRLCDLYRRSIHTRGALGFDGGVRRGGARSCRCPLVDSMRCLASLQISQAAGGGASRRSLTET